MSEITRQEFTDLLVNPQYMEQITQTADHATLHTGLGARMIVTKDTPESPLVLSPVEIPDDNTRSSILSAEWPYMSLYVTGSYNRFPTSQGHAPVVTHFDLDTFHNDLSKGLRHRLIGGIVTSDAATLYFRHRETLRWLFGENLDSLRDIGEATDVNHAAHRLTAAGLNCYIRQSGKSPGRRIDRPFYLLSNFFAD